MFYESLKKVDGVVEENIKIFSGEERRSYGLFEYKDTKFSYIDILLNEDINIYNVFLKSSFKMPSDKKRFKADLNDFIRDKVKNIPTIKYEYQIEDDNVIFEFSNQVPYAYKSSKENWADIIKPMLDLLIFANIKVLLFFTQKNAKE